MSLKNKCPFCRKNELEIIPSTREKDIDKYKTTIEYKCNKCERTVRVLEKKVILET